jgi:hypothetical protein
MTMADIQLKDSIKLPKRILYSSIPQRERNAIYYAAILHSLIIPGNGHSKISSNQFKSISEKLGWSVKKLSVVFRLLKELKMVNTAKCGQTTHYYLNTLGHNSKCFKINTLQALEMGTINSLIVFQLIQQNIKYSNSTSNISGQQHIHPGTRSNGAKLTREYFANILQLEVTSITKITKKLEKINAINVDRDFCAFTKKNVINKYSIKNSNKSTIQPAIVGDPVQCAKRNNRPKRNRPSILGEAVECDKLNQFVKYLNNNIEKLNEKGIVKTQRKLSNRNVNSIINKCIHKNSIDFLKPIINNIQCKVVRNDYAKSWKENYKFSFSEKPCNGIKKMLDNEKQLKETRGYNILFEKKSQKDIEKELLKYPMVLRDLYNTPQWHLI